MMDALFGKFGQISLLDKTMLGADIRISKSCASQ
jgi:hypothetical protein